MHSEELRPTVRCRKYQMTWLPPWPNPQNPKVTKTICLHHTTDFSRFDTISSHECLRTHFSLFLLFLLISCSAWRCSSKTFYREWLASIICPGLSPGSSLVWRAHGLTGGQAGQVSGANMKLSQQFIALSDSFSGYEEGILVVAPIDY